MASASIDGVHVLRQETDVWCWCAVTQAVLAFYASPAPAQCQIAESVLGSSQCCNDPNFCYTIEDLALSLRQYGHLDGGPLAGFSAGDVITCLQTGRPACVRVLYELGGHVLAVSGIDTDHSLVRLHDPFYADAFMWWHFDGDILSRESESDVTGTWTCTTTYITKP